ncbi:MAG: FtsH protease activity modulator HflK [Francisellaceae bacterium]|jgi:modulator of FtsH protease HflK|nr:FtsH protease activity modulator HflK [Francisellaceae bacterium]MBT6538318.1 FtsH protease activity modulator HflK [Francisellaceae bacterium]
MAWNEPGGGDKQNKKDDDNQWGSKKGKNEGPPELDELFSKLAEKLKGVMGGGGESQSSDFSVKHLAVPLILLTCIYIAAGFFVVKPPERAVITKFGKYEEQVGQGLHWIPLFIKDKAIVNAEAIRSTRRSGLMLTKDINLVSVIIEVQYRVKDVRQYLFNVRNPSLALDEASDSALRQVIGHSKFDYIISVGKEDIAKKIENQIQETLDGYKAGIKVTTLALKEAIYPKDVESSFDDVTKAKEEREQLKHDAEAYANKVIPEAYGLSEKIKELAEAYKEETILNAEGQTLRFKQVLPEYLKAPEITRKRIYLATMQKVLSNTSKVLIDVPGGNNLMYLPLDKLMESNRVSEDESTQQQAKSSNNYNQVQVSTADDLERSRRDRRRR